MKPLSLGEARAILKGTWSLWKVYEGFHNIYSLQVSSTITPAAAVHNPLAVTGGSRKHTPRTTDSCAGLVCRNHT